MILLMFTSESFNELICQELNIRKIIYELTKLLSKQSDGIL